jgi:hypothetical protein
MIIPLICLFLDIVSFSLVQSWVLHSLLIYSVLLYTSEPRGKVLSTKIFLSLVLLAAQDTIIFGRFGLSLVYLIPLLVLAFHGRIWFGKSPILPISLALLALLCNEILLKVLILGGSFTLSSTVMVLFVNLLLVAVKVKFFEKSGVRGNRSLA